MDQLIRLKLLLSEAKTLALTSDKYIFEDLHELNSKLSEILTTPSPVLKLEKLNEMDSSLAALMYRALTSVTTKTTWAKILEVNGQLSVTTSKFIKKINFAEEVDEVPASPEGTFFEKKKSQLPEVYMEKQKSPPSVLDRRPMTQEEVLVQDERSPPHVILQRHAVLEEISVKEEKSSPPGIERRPVIQEKVLVQNEKSPPPVIIQQQVVPEKENRRPPDSKQSPENRQEVSVRSSPVTEQRPEAGEEGYPGDNKRANIPQTQLAGSPGRSPSNSYNRKSSSRTGNSRSIPAPMYLPPIRSLSKEYSPYYPPNPRQKNNQSGEEHSGHSTAVDPEL